MSGIVAGCLLRTPCRMCTRLCRADRSPVLGPARAPRKRAITLFKGSWVLHEVNTRSPTARKASLGDEDSIVRAPAQVTAQGVKVVQQSTFLKALGASVALALGGAVVAMLIDQYSNVPCTITGDCAQISTTMKALLVGTHLYTFLLIPATMYVFYDKIEELREDRARSPFTIVLGLSLIMVAIMGEIGWHISQDWYYKEEYNIQNMAFYFFLNTGLSLWAFGLRLNQGTSENITTSTPFLAAPQALEVANTSKADQRSPLGLIPSFSLGDAADYFLLAVAPLTLGLYYLGAAEIHSKVPIYIMMSLVFTVLSWRFWSVLKTPKVLLFPLFSVGVNLGFIALLAKYQTDAFLNPLFHILHDAAGTEMGIAIIAVLTYSSKELLDEPPTGSSS